VEDISAQLADMGFDSSTPSSILSSSPTVAMVLRCSRNITVSISKTHERAMAHYTNPGLDHSTTASNFPDTESAFYGALWAWILLGVHSNGEGPVAGTLRWQQCLSHILGIVEAHYPTDVFVVEQHIAPLFPTLPESSQLRDTVRVVREGDTMPKQIKQRAKDSACHVRFRVGQVFQHRRYAYLAVITGWDVECGADDDWIESMGVHHLSRGRHQSFYHVL
jgi:F-box protein 21